MFENLTIVEFGIGGGGFAILTTIAAILGFAKKYFRKRKIKKILEFTDAAYTYTIPVSEGVSWSSRTPTGKKKGFLVRYEETMIPAKLASRMSATLKYKYDIEPCKDIEEKNEKLLYLPDDMLNRFVCGGPFTNPDTYSLLKNKCGSIKFPYLAERYEEDKEKNPEKLQFACPYNEKDDILTILYGADEEKFSYNKGENVVFLARLKGDVDFGCNRGTIHILFGTSTKATIKSVELLFQYTDTLYDIVQKYKGSHYAYLIKVSASNEIDFSSCRDITHALFK